MTAALRADFLRRVRDLPVLGLGVSTEYGASATPGALDPMALREAHPDFGALLEVGVEASRGLDETARAWAARQWPTTYHFLDVNLDDPEDFDEPWLDSVRALVSVLSPAWICGDAGLWHFGRREPGTMLLLPPILSDETATAQAAGIARLREATGLEVLPENPPGHFFLGDLHLLDHFARVCERADTGFLLDCAHLAIYQRVKGNAPLSGLDAFPMERIVELHVAGAREDTVDGLAFLEDDHTPDVLPATWEILEYVIPRAPNLRAVIFECERNPMADCLDGFTRIARTLAGSPSLSSLTGLM